MDNFSCLHVCFPQLKYKSCEEETWYFSLFYSQSKYSVHRALLVLNRYLSSECMHASDDLLGRVWGNSYCLGLLKDQIQLDSTLWSFNNSLLMCRKREIHEMFHLCANPTQELLRILGRNLAGCPCVSVISASEITVIISITWKYFED